MRIVRAKTNDLIRANAHSLGAILCDWAPIISLDPTDDSAKAIAGYLADELHPNWQGGMELGRFLAAIIRQKAVIPPPYALPASGDAAWSSANPYLTGGTTIATGWDIAPFGTPTPTWTASKIATGGQRIAIATGAVPGENSNTHFYRDTTITDDSVDAVNMFGVADLLMPDTTEIFAISLEVRLWNVDASTDQYVRHLWPGGSSDILAMSRVPNQPYGRLFLKTPMRPMPAGTGTDRRRASFSLRIYGPGPVGILAAGVIKA
jgi:hypothetical protein